MKILPTTAILLRINQLKLIVKIHLYAGFKVMVFMSNREIFNSVYLFVVSDLCGSLLSVSKDQFKKS